MQYKSFILFPDFGTNTWLLWRDGEAALIDPAKPGEAIAAFVRQHELTVRYIINTHSHFDHIGGNAWARQTFGAPLCIHEEDAPALPHPQGNLSSLAGCPFASPAADRTLRHNDELPLGEGVLRVIHTPGHTPGGICLLGDGVLVSGDTLFDHGVGRTDLAGGNTDKLLRSIEDRLLTLPGETVVLPGHGPTTTIEDEAVGNPFVGMMR